MQPVVDASATASCPAGSTLTGGGYSTEPIGNAELFNANVIESVPASNAANLATGWRVSLRYEFRNSAPVSTAFALCARQNLAQATVVSQSHVAFAFTEENNSVDCPLNTFTTGGGYSISPGFLQPRYVTLSGASNEFGTWRTAQVLPPGQESRALAGCIPMPNIPNPRVKITSPADRAIAKIVPGTGNTGPITFSATATDEKGAAISSLQWFLNGVPIVNQKGTSFSMPLGAEAIGPVRVRVTAMGSTTSASDQITISVVQE
jgi:Penicillin-Binding Protein C-terminus Family